MTPESFQERLEDILKDVSWSAELKQAILELLKESLPKREDSLAEFDINDRWHIHGWNDYRTELLRRWGLQ